MNNNLTKKRTLLFALFLLMGAFYKLHAAKLVHQPYKPIQKVDVAVGLPRLRWKLLVRGYCSKYNIPEEIGLLIVYFVYDDPLKYKNKTLPNDLSGRDLSGFDFTGCAFTYTNLTDADLTHVILTNTICDYQKVFRDNIKKNRCSGGDWYQNNLPLDLKSIAAVYPKLNNNTHKAKLLQIACGFSQLSFYAGKDFWIKVDYWSCELLRLKQMLGSENSGYGYKLVCSLASDLKWDANNYCWKNEYPQNKINIAFKVSHANFAQYLKEFHDGLMQYKCQSKNELLGFGYYKEKITKSIVGLQKAYPKIRDKQLQQEACNIAHALSKSYQIQQENLLYHYLFHQKRLIWLKHSVSGGAENDIHYSNKARDVMRYAMLWEPRE